jgi:hypothetical protein
MENTINFQNEFGTVVLTAIKDYMPIQDVSFAKCPIIKKVLIPMDVLEQVALITNNKGIQISFAPDVSLGAYIIHHKSPNVVAICRLTSIRYISKSGRDACNQIAHMKPKVYGNACGVSV